MAEFLSMGSHAAYVWGSYGLTLAGLGLLFWLALRLRRKARDWRALAGDDQP